MSKTTKHFESWWGKTCLGTGCKEIKILSTKTYSDTRVRRGGADLFWHSLRGGKDPRRVLGTRTRRGGGRRVWALAARR